MDHGAARSRKQANLAKLDPSQTTRKQPPKPRLPTSAPPAAPGPSRFKPKVIDNTDPARFRPKAIRDSVALIWSQGDFALPPPSETLSKITRVDLTGSPCTDISWLSGTNVTWLSLKGCKIEKGWDEVGALENLAGEPQCVDYADMLVLNISDTGLKSLPNSFRNLTKLKALVAMNLSWHAMDEEIVGQWSQLNSLSKCNNDRDLVIRLLISSHFPFAQFDFFAPKSRSFVATLETHLLSLSPSVSWQDPRPFRAAVATGCQDEQSGSC
jgi:hypothetical protein